MTLHSRFDPEDSRAELAAHGYRSAEPYAPSCFSCALCEQDHHTLSHFPGHGDGVFLYCRLSVERRAHSATLWGNYREDPTQRNVCDRYRFGLPHSDPGDAENALSYFLAERNNFLQRIGDESASDAERQQLIQLLAEPLPE